MVTDTPIQKGPTTATNILIGRVNERFTACLFTRHAFPNLLDRFFFFFFFFLVKLIYRVNIIANICAFIFMEFEIFVKIDLEEDVKYRKLFVKCNIRKVKRIFI